MAQVIIAKGLPSSGKTTWARSMLAAEPGRYKRVNKDELRLMLDNGRYSKDNEVFIEAARDRLILAALDAGKDVIVDDTNLDSRHQVHIGRLVDGRAEVIVKFFDVPLEECIERDRSRPAPVGERVIRQMHRDYLQPVSRPLHDRVGGDEFFVALVERFYDVVEHDPVLRPLYPDDLSEPRTWLTAFLVQYWGGATRYSDERGHPRLRMRHAPFVIGQAERDAWWRAMESAVRTSTAGPEEQAELLAYFDQAATFMINRP